MSSGRASTATLVRRLRDVGADLGWARALLLAPRWAVHRRYLVFVSDLTRPQACAAGGGADLRVSLLREADAGAIGALDPAMTPAEVRRRLGEGQQCLLGWWREQLAHYRWESRRPAFLPYLGRVLRPLEGDQILIDVFTGPAFRGHGIASAVMLEGMERARLAGCLRLVWLAAAWNAGSAGMREKLGEYRRVGSVEDWRLPLVRRCRCDGSARLLPDGALAVDRYPGSP